MKKILMASLLIAFQSLAYAENPAPLSADSLKVIESAKEKYPSFDLAQKKQVLVYFWASWCPDCRDKLRGKIQSELKTFPQTELVLVDMDKDAERGEEFVKQEKLTSVVIRDNSKTLSKEFKVFAVPSWALLEKDDKGQWQVKSAESGANLENIDKALKGKSL